MLVRSRALVGAALVLAASTVGLVAAARRNASPQDAKSFLDKTEADLEKLQIDAERANWVKSTYINDDTELLSAQADEHLISASVKAAKQSAQFTGLKLDPVSARKLDLLRNSLTLAAPADPAASSEVTRLAAFLEGAYGKGKYCPAGRNRCYDLEELSRILATSRDPEALRDAWVGWHSIAPPLRKPYERFVALSNQGAKEIGFADTGAMWKSKYDHAPGGVRPRARPSLGAGPAACTSRCTPTSGRACAPPMDRTSCPPTVPSPPISWATCGPRSGATSIRW